MSRSIEREAMR